MQAKGMKGGPFYWSEVHTLLAAHLVSQPIANFTHSLDRISTRHKYKPTDNERKQCSNWQAVHVSNYETNTDESDQNASPGSLCPWHTQELIFRDPVLTLNWVSLSVP